MTWYELTLETGLRIAVEAELDFSQIMNIIFSEKDKFIVFKLKTPSPVDSHFAVRANSIVTVEPKNADNIAGIQKYILGK